MVDDAPRPPRLPPLRAMVMPMLAAVGAVVLLFLGFLVYYQIRPGPEVQVAADGRAPAFALPSTDGTTVRLSDLRGRPVFVNFWAVWCGPCLNELPTFARFSRDHPDVAVLGLAVDSGNARVLAIAKDRLNIPYPVLIADEGVIEQYGASVLPTTVLIDADGRLVEAWTGMMFGWQLDAAIDRLAVK